MSGKFERGKKNKSKRTRKVLWTVIILLALLLAGLALFAKYLENTDPMPHVTEPVGETTGTEPVTTGDAEQTTSAEQAEMVMDLGGCVMITEYLSYTGAFMEDRTDEVVTDVLAIRVTNTGEEYIQTMDITLLAGDVEAVFSLSTLFPGETAIVLEKNRMAYSTAPEFTEARLSTLALFQEKPTLCEDQLEIQCLNGVINIINISSQDITGDIYVYYKNCINDVYYGGITYRIRIQGGLKAGEIRQGSAAHFNPGTSSIVFVTCG